MTSPLCAASHCNVALSQANTGQAIATLHYPKQIPGKPLQRRIIPSKYWASRCNVATASTENRASRCNVALSQANTGQAVATLQWPQLKIVQAVATLHYPQQILGKPLQRCNGLN
ncbi:MAG: hypothetical protein LBF91_09125, partial [Azoarcus sp.]|nr:hypothetical protein [Azoarcus sp.]